MSEPSERTPAVQPIMRDLDEGVAWEMVEALPDGMVVVDEGGTMLFVNRRIEALFAADRTELVGNPIETLLPAGDRAIHRAHRTRYRADPSVREMGAGRELRERRRDGTEFPVEVSLSPMEGSRGLQVVATVRDIADRVEQEADRRAVFRALGAARDAVFLFRVDSLKFTYVNDGALTQLGYGRDDLLTMTPLHVNPEFTEASFREMMQPVLAGIVESQVFVTTHRRRDGGDVPVEDDLVIQRLFGAGTGLQAVQAKGIDPSSRVGNGVAQSRGTRPSRRGHCIDRSGGRWHRHQGDLDGPVPLMADDRPGGRAAVSARGETNIAAEGRWSLGELESLRDAGHMGDASSRQSTPSVVLPIGGLRVRPRAERGG